MIQDPLVRIFITEVNRALKEESEALVSAPFDRLYTLGRAQGKIDGLKSALEILFKISEELDT
jgi:hypothetical protein